ncbi:MAG TPA: SLBB domain-containing protein, partial [Pseudomonadales bacterium]|nr:SLBB domain-containing protein [Pseudomonadales bacterium]
PYSEQIRIIGQAARPQSLPYKQHMTLLDVMIAVGGVTDFADANRVQLARIVNGQQEVYRVRLDDLVNGGDISANVDMRPGDILIIPEAWF